MTRSAGIRRQLKWIGTVAYIAFVVVFIMSARISAWSGFTIGALTSLTQS